MRKCTILDGPMGSELESRGFALGLPTWSATAVRKAPALVREIHAAYVNAGATVHTANTFRTQPRHFPDTFAALTSEAIALARAAVPKTHRVFGSVAPLEDCYRPDLARTDSSAVRAHGEMVGALVDAGVDGLVCESFSNLDEGLLAARLAAASRCETWLSFTPGPAGTLLSAEEIAVGAERALDLGVDAVLINCATIEFVDRALEGLARVCEKFGVYANAYGVSPEAYADAGVRWRKAGATILGACCGASAAHVRALAECVARVDVAYR